MSGAFRRSVKTSSLNNYHCVPKLFTHFIVWYNVDEVICYGNKLIN